MRAVVVSGRGVREAGEAKGTRVMVISSSPIQSPFYEGQDGSSRDCSLQRHTSKQDKAVLQTILRHMAVADGVWGVDGDSKIGSASRALEVLSIALTDRLQSG